MGKEKPVDLSIGDQLPLGSRLRLVRQHGGRRLSHVASAAGYDRGYLSRVENNIASPSEEALASLASELGMTIEEIREAPIEQLLSREIPAEVSISSGTVYAAKERTAGQRVDRILVMTHLPKNQEDWVADRIVAITSELASFAKGLPELNEVSTPTETTPRSIN